MNDVTRMLLTLAICSVVTIVIAAVADTFERMRRWMWDTTNVVAAAIYLFYWMVLLGGF